MRKIITVGFEVVAFLYFLIGVVCGLTIYYPQIDLVIPDFFVNSYYVTFIWFPYFYLLFGCLLFSYGNFWLNIVDCILCFLLSVFYPYPVYVEIYNFNKYLYYLLGFCFSFLPMLVCVVRKNKVDFNHIFKTITRILMVIFFVLVILILNSCGASSGM